jgi:hypothetical protein
MSTLKTFRVSTNSGDQEVTLEVDMDKLTPALATTVNNFWGEASDRVHAEDGNVVHAVVRLYGARLIREMLDDGGASFGKSSEDLQRAWTQRMRAEEGWPSSDGTPHGELGIRVMDAEVEAPNFDSVDLDEVTS